MNGTSIVGLVLASWILSSEMCLDVVALAKTGSMYFGSTGLLTISSPKECIRSCKSQLFVKREHGSTGQLQFLCPMSAYSRPDGKWKQNIFSIVVDHWEMLGDMQVVVIAGKVIR